MASTLRLAAELPLLFLVLQVWMMPWRDFHNGRVVSEGRGPQQGSVCGGLCTCNISTPTPCLVDFWSRRVQEIELCSIGRFISPQIPQQGRSKHLHLAQVLTIANQELFYFLTTLDNFNMDVLGKYLQFLLNSLDYIQHGVKACPQPLLPFKPDL